MGAFSFIFQRLEIAGPRVGEPDIKKLVATDELWEARVKDPTGTYRMLFRFGKVDCRRVAAVAYGRKKNANVALAVVSLRERHGLTQRALAERIGAPQPVIARLESGRHPVEIKLLARIADAEGETWSVSFAPPADEPLAPVRSTAG